MGNIKFNPEDFPSNSKTKTQEKKVEKIIHGKAKIKGKSLGKKISEAFTGDETQSVFSYILYDILIPAAKSMIFDIVTGGMEMKLFGTSSGKIYRNRHDPRRKANGTYISYDSYYKEKDKTSDRPITRPSSKYSDLTIEFDSRDEANEVLNHLSDIANDYDFASVSDLCDLAGLESAYTDNKYGWRAKDLAKSEVRYVRGSWVLILPRALSID